MLCMQQRQVPAGSRIDISDQGGSVGSARGLGPPPPHCHPTPPPTSIGANRTRTRLALERWHWRGGTWRRPRRPRPATSHQSRQANRRGGEGGRPLRAKGAALASQLPCRPGVCRTTSHAFNLLYRRWQAEAHPIPLYEYQRWYRAISACCDGISSRDGLSSLGGGDGI